MTDWTDAHQDAHDLVAGIEGFREELVIARKPPLDDEANRQLEVLRNSINNQADAISSIVASAAADDPYKSKLEAAQSLLRSAGSTMFQGANADGDDARQAVYDQVDHELFSAASGLG
jgi:hypothetical protein